MSVEIRIVCDRPDGCTFGIPKPIDFDDHCRHHTECDWGRIENSEADPKSGIRHLMLTTGDYVKQLLIGGPQELRNGYVDSATSDGNRLFAHVDYDRRRWTWELFDAHFWDDLGPDNLMIGRWPD